MSNTLVNAIRDLKLSAIAKPVLWALADAVNEKDVDMCWPELATLCRWTCLSRASVKRALVELEERRLLKRHRTGRATRYQLTLSLQRAHTEPSEVSEGAPESEGIRIEPQKAHPEPSALPVSHQKAHAPLEADTSPEAQARRIASTMPDPEAAYRGALERLQTLKSRHAQPQEAPQAASSLLERMSSAKVLRRGGRLHR
jgi:hypothetical protein